MKRICLLLTALLLIGCIVPASAEAPDAAARRRNRMEAALDSGYDCLGTAPEGAPYGPDAWGTLLAVPGGGALPLYDAPDGGHRPAGETPPDGQVYLLRRHLNEAGETWACVRCFSDPGRQRIGWVRAESLGLEPLMENGDQPGEQFIRVEAEAAEDTFLTDDPDGSLRRRLEVPKGACLTCLGLYNNGFVYVSAEEGLWGFVPGEALIPAEKPVRRDVMDALAGEWDFYAGGSMADDRLILRADGTFEGWDVDWEAWEAETEEYVGPRPGVWFVTEYDPAENLYWEDCRLEMTLLYDDGSATVRGLIVENENQFSLIFWEGGGGYLRRGALDPWGE